MISSLNCHIFSALSNGIYIYTRVFGKYFGKWILPASRHAGNAGNAGSRQKIFHRQNVGK